MNWKLIWRGLKNANMRNKLLAVFAILLVYRALSHIPVPLAEPGELKQLLDNFLTNENVPQLLSVYNVISGGALASLSIMLVGLGPYINASIVMQVLTRAIPKLEKLQKEGGEHGRKKISQYTRILTLPLAIIQSILILLVVVGPLASQVSGLGDIIASATLWDKTLMVATLTAGAMILMWLGELITERGIGNGISLLITVAIVSQLPFMFTALYRSVITDGVQTVYGESPVIAATAEAPVINIGEGVEPRTFQATLAGGEAVAWQYVFTDGQESCSTAADFSAAETYEAGEDVLYETSDDGRRVCFKAETETAALYAASGVINTDEAAVNLTVQTGTAAGSFAANDTEVEATAWHYVVTDADAICETTDFGSAVSYSEGADVAFEADNAGRKLCFRSQSGEVFSVFGWFNLPINGRSLAYTAMLLGSALLLTIFVVYLNEAYRRIKLSYAKKVQGNRFYSDVSTTLPIKLISAGVIPIIFALAFLSVPQMIGQILVDTADPFWSNLGLNLSTWFAPPGSLTNPGEAVFASAANYIYPVAYFLLVVLFTYFYTSIIFSAKDISERLQRQGGFIEGVRPGEDTQKYLAAVVSRLNFFGAISLGFLALTPILAQAFLGTDLLALGGTSILILVAVALETLRQIESKSLMVTYEDYEQSFQNRDQDEKPKRRQRRVKKDL